MSMYGRSSRRPVVVCGPGRTKQEFKDECDVNNIVARYVRDAFWSHLAKGVPQFVDVSEVGDFKEAVDQVRSATEFFNHLPAALRTRFGNDVARFMDEAGQMTRDELREFGLAELRSSDRRRRKVDAEAAAPQGGAAASTVSS